MAPSGRTTGGATSRASPRPAGAGARSLFLRRAAVRSAIAQRAWPPRRSHCRGATCERQPRSGLCVDPRRSYWRRPTASTLPARSSPAWRHTRPASKPMAQGTCSGRTPRWVTRTGCLPRLDRAIDERSSVRGVPVRGSAFSTGTGPTLASGGRSAGRTSATVTGLGSADLRTRKLSIGMPFRALPSRLSLATYDCHRQGTERHPRRARTASPANSCSSSTTGCASPARSKSAWSTSTGRPR